VAFAETVHGPEVTEKAKEEHALAPDEETWPDGHPRHVADDIALVAEEEVPAGQLVQLDAPEAEAYEPEGQAEQGDTLFAEKVPAMQSVPQAVADVAPGNEFRPVGQAKQVDDDVAPEAAEKLPAAQFVHLTEESLGAYKPAGQLAHAVKPAYGENLPAAQLLHVP